MQDGLEYVVYQKAQSYPEYLVLYKRTIYDDVNDVLTGLCPDYWWAGT